MTTRVLTPALALALLPLASAQADTSTALPITSFYQIVADTARGHLFISQGSPSVNTILVTDLAGNEVTTITGQDGVKGIALSPDGSALYAALGASGAVTAIDTSTLKQTASYPLGIGDSPVDVAVQSGKVWVSYNTSIGAAIGDIDVSANLPSFHAQANMGGWPSAPQLAADPRDTGVLVASTGFVTSYDTTVDPATVRAQSTLSGNCENERDLAVAPGGSEVILACGWPYAHYRYSTADLSQLGFYPSTNYPDAVAVDANGDVAAGTETSSGSPDLYIYAQDSNTPLNTFNLANSSGGDPVPRGLAWSPDGSKLFAVLGNDSLQVIDNPTLRPSALSLTGPSVAYITKQVTLKGALILKAGGTLPAGTPITITRTVNGGTGIKHFAVTTAADGGYTLADTPPALGQYTYTAVYGGNTTTAAATASHAVTVSRIPPSLTLQTGSTTFIYEPTVHVTVHLGATYSNRTVSIYAKPFGSASRMLLRTGTVNSSGNLSISYLAPYNTTFSVVFTGDKYYAPKTVTRVVYVRAKVTESLTGYYTSKTIGGRAYRLYHRSNLLYAHATVSPNKHGQCVRFEVQEHYRGAWHPSVISGCIKLNSSSKASIAFNVSRANLGYPYRIRADYIPADNRNKSNDSAWQYVMITS